MVAFPHIGAGPYGTSRKSPYTSTTETPKLDAAEIEDIFQSMNNSQKQVAVTPSSSSRFRWFSRHATKKSNSGGKSESK
ncbi:hypothetical protein N7509_012000 [Penicillium cosmopolitanum]|uniref:Uncharacterized protein n=1 Tax=Penicillium cosmopolitanum TaxID=1131564 RepID=A0A9W9VGU1_9EURO|nr:uncharacterized protein N7509_012000 [Penicillium cosmopolitanum]KAJ5378881.1 hypothetical protein N7509_012000 [Penicillium cosmopolitanum]